MLGLTIVWVPGIVMQELDEVLRLPVAIVLLDGTIGGLQEDGRESTNLELVSWEVIGSGINLGDDQCLDIFHHLTETVPFRSQALAVSAYIYNIIYNKDGNEVEVGVRMRGNTCGH